jgi:hypothetical protein
MPHWMISTPQLKKKFLSRKRFFSMKKEWLQLKRGSKVLLIRSGSVFITSIIKGKLPESGSRNNINNVNTSTSKSYARDN